MRISDWSSDVCSSDLAQQLAVDAAVLQALDLLVDPVLPELAHHLRGGLVGDRALVKRLPGQQAGRAEAGRPPRPAAAGLRVGLVTHGLYSLSGAWVQRSKRCQQRYTSHISRAALAATPPLFFPFHYTP